MPWRDFRPSHSRTLPESSLKSICPTSQPAAQNPCLHGDLGPPLIPNRGWVFHSEQLSGSARVMPAGVAAVDGTPRSLGYSECLAAHSSFVHDRLAKLLVSRVTAPSRVQEGLHPGLVKL